jgi:hypothetical protein
VAANWSLNADIEKSDARIQAASEGLTRHFSLPDSLQTALASRLRKNLRDPLNALLEKQLSIHEAVADLLESVLSHLSDRDEAMVSHSSLPDDFPARNALAHAGIMSVEQLAGMKEDDLTAISGIGKAQAYRILNAEKSYRREKERAAQPVKPTQAKQPEQFPVSASSAPSQEAKPSPSSPPALPVVPVVPKEPDAKEEAK